MKVRVKLTGTAKALEVGEGDQCTLSQLRTKTAEIFQIEERSFSLSLNKKEALEGDDHTLSELGIVPGDIIFVQTHLTTSGDNVSSTENQESPASSSNECSFANNKKGQIGSAVHASGSATVCHEWNHEDSQLPPTYSETAVVQKDDSSSNLQTEHSAHDPDSTEDQGKEKDCVSPSPLEDPEVNRCLQEPLLCRESSFSAVPVQLRDLFCSAKCRTSTDALWVVVHTLMLEVGFRPQCADLVMREGWNQQGFYKQEYQHVCVTTGYSCSVIGVPMGPVLILHGVSNDDPPVKTDSQQVKIADYIQVVSEDVCKVYKNLERLSRTVKDFICQPLLSHLSDVCGFPVASGLLSVSFELKLKLLSYLPSCSLVRMGQVCKAYNLTYKDPWLWRRLFLREFGRHGDNSLNKDWYQLYKEEWLMRKERRKWLCHKRKMSIPPWLSAPPGHFPPMAPMPYPSGIIGGDYDLNPEFTSGIPHPLFNQPRNPDYFFPQAPGVPRNPFLPSPRFQDPFGPGDCPNTSFPALGGGSTRGSRPSPFRPFGGRFL